MANVAPQSQAIVSEIVKTVATTERINHAGEEGVETDASGRQRIISAPLDRLLKMGIITPREFRAGEKYRTDAYMSATDPAASAVDWNAAGGGTGGRVPTMFSSQSIANARIRFRQINRKIPRNSTVSTMLYLGLIKEYELAEIGRSVFGLSDRREAEIAARSGLRVALAALADHYGG